MYIIIRFLTNIICKILKHIGRDRINACTCSRLLILIDEKDEKKHKRKQQKPKLTHVSVLLSNEPRPFKCLNCFFQ